MKRQHGPASPRGKHETFLTFLTWASKDAPTHLQSAILGRTGEEAGAALGQAMGAVVGTLPMRRHLLQVTSTAAKMHLGVSPVTLEMQ